jgi:AraC family ethanolamine operon transcriptional activator
MPNLSLQTHCFRDADLCSSMFREWGLQFRQLAPKPFQGVVSRWHSDGFSVSRFHANCRVEIIGEKPRDALAFCSILETQSRPHFTHEIRLQPNYIFGFDAQRETNVVSSAGGFHMLMVQVDKRHWQVLTEQLGEAALDDAFLRQNIVAVPPDDINGYRQYLSQILYLIDHQPSYFQSPENTRLIAGDLLPLLCDALRPPHQTPKPLRRAEIVAQARDYMTANLDRPITLAELSIAVHASRRSLIYGFQDIFGMGPMAYLKQQRLNGVRQALLLADPEHETVANIAHAWGFYSLGHFAHDYRGLFGEAPSATLRYAT